MYSPHMHKEAGIKQGQFSRMIGGKKTEDKLQYRSMARYGKKIQRRANGKNCLTTKQYEKWHRKPLPASCQQSSSVLSVAPISQYILLILFLLLLINCSGTAPEIIELRWRLNLNFAPRVSDNLQASNTTGRESLSVFIQPADDDGLEDLDSMYLIHEDQDLFWALDSSQWKATTDARVFWVGSNRFSSGYLGSLPRGRYKIQLYDKAGDMAQRSFELQAANALSLSSRVTVPQIGDELLFLLPKDVALYSIIGYNIADDILFIDANYQSIISLKELKIRNDELERVMLQFEFSDTHVVAQIGPYMVPQISNQHQALTSPETTDNTSGRAANSSQEPTSQNSDNNTTAHPRTLPEADIQEPIDTYIPSPDKIAP